MILTNEFVSFFRELRENNTKEWFDKNRKRYETDVKKPFYQLITDVISMMNEYEPIDLQPKDTVFRINKDIRFSKDKSPYKTHVAAIVSSKGRKNLEYPGLYFDLGAEEMGIGGGAYMLSKELLLNVRYALAENPTKIDKIVTHKAFTSLFGELKGEKNKILPKEFKPYWEKQPLIANKQFYCHTTYPIDPLIADNTNLVQLLKQHYEATKPLNDYLIDIMY